jgi:hypothetical protein
MLCAECGTEAIGDAWGWMAFRDDNADDEAVLVFYCSGCAHLEFGDYLPDRRPRGEDAL